MNEKVSIKDLLKASPTYLRKQVRVLLAYVVHQEPSFVVSHADYSLTLSEHKLFQELYARLVRGEPISRLIQKREFWGLDFMLNEETLDPRADSEILVDAVCKYVQSKLANKPISILDLGTGTGCLMISLLQELPHAQGWGVDISEKTLACAQDNAVAHNVSDRLRLVQSCWFQNVQGRFDIIISNPPYIPTQDIETLDENVRKYDPLRALDGGENGLKAYEQILKGLEPHTYAHSRIFFEIGYDQNQKLMDLLTSYNIKYIQTYQDYNGNNRVMELAVVS